MMNEIKKKKIHKYFQSSWVRNCFCKRRGFEPYHAAISRLSLSKRGPRGSAQNYQRVKEIGDALHRIRTGQVGST